MCVCVSSPARSALMTFVQVCALLRAAYCSTPGGFLSPFVTEKRIPFGDSPRQPRPPKTIPQAISARTWCMSSQLIRTSVPTLPVSQSCVRACERARAHVRGTGMAVKITDVIGHRTKGARLDMQAFGCAIWIFAIFIRQAERSWTREDVIGENFPKRLHAIVVKSRKIKLSIKYSRCTVLFWQPQALCILA